MTKKVEIDESQLAILQRAHKVLTDLNAKPDSRRHLESGLKILNPELETEADIIERNAKPYIERIEDANKRVAALEKQLADDAAARKAAADAAAVAVQMQWLDEQNYTEEGKTKIKAMMTERGIADVTAAAALFDKQNPKPVSVAGANYESDSWNLRGDGKDENLKQLFTNEDQWADNEVQTTLNEMRRAQANAQAA